MNRRIGAATGGQSNTCSIALSLRASTGPAGPSQTMAGTSRGPSGTATMAPAGGASVPGATA